MTEEKNISFEEALDGLEKIVASMEQGDMKLSEMMDKYALGVKLSDICAKSLSRAEKTMDLMVRPNPDGSIDEVAMEDEV
ncbi:MAG: exodeoxyribonuclease VII small subunit [Veillonellaceae bacterium]|nr:exodeoxyribonuclease VII small subunit [Veillonellaceae bacterium]MDD6922829.1 exodeoxyribonuclease VII small subunit [Veillonellaceae bacterium]